MTTLTFAGAPLAPLGAIRRPCPSRRIRRGDTNEMPDAFMGLFGEHWGLDARTVWNLWQAVACARYSEVRALAKQFRMWPMTLEKVRDLGVRGISPWMLIKMFELLLVEGKIGTVQIPVDSLFAQTQRYARFRQINCSLLWHRFERCHFCPFVKGAETSEVS